LGAEAPAAGALVRLGLGPRVGFVAELFEQFRRLELGQVTALDQGIGQRARRGGRLGSGDLLAQFRQDGLVQQARLFESRKKPVCGHQYSPSSTVISWTCSIPTSVPASKAATTFS
jgi:hypothetical protein